MDLMLLFQSIGGTLFTLFIPGFSWSFLFFERGKISVVERIALSFVLSIALIPLTIFWINIIFQLSFTLVNSFMVALALTLIPILLIYIKNKWKTMKGSKKRVIISGQVKVCKGKENE